VFFVAFRLKDSLPYEVLESLREEREPAKVALRVLPESERVNQNTLDEQRYFEKWEDHLDKAKFGPCWLSQSEIGDVMKEAIHYRDGKVLDLHAFCILPNHVQIVFETRKSDWQHRTSDAAQVSDLLFLGLIEEIIYPEMLI